MDRLAELKNGCDYSKLEENVQSMTNDEIIRKVFNDKIEALMDDIKELETINESIRKMILDRNYNINSLVNASKRSVKGLINTLKSLQSKCSDKYQFNMLNMCKTKLSEVSTENNSLIQDCRNKHRRQFKVHGDISDSEVDKMIAEGLQPRDYVTKQILQGYDASSIVANARQDVNDKYQDVLKLETNIAELHLFFLDLSVLTQTQGEMLDNIEKAAKTAADYIDEGNGELVESIEEAKKLCQKKFCIALIVLTIVGVIVGVIAAKLS